MRHSLRNVLHQFCVGSIDWQVRSLEGNSGQNFVVLGRLYLFVCSQLWKWSKLRIGILVGKCFLVNSSVKLLTVLPCSSRALLRGTRVQRLPIWKNRPSDTVLQQLWWDCSIYSTWCSHLSRIWASCCPRSWRRTQRSWNLFCLRPFCISNGVILHLSLSWRGKTDMATGRLKTSPFIEDLRSCGFQLRCICKFSGLLGPVFGELVLLLNR
mmetsp:Transcript_32615/g.63874  ORF Transcript_32615/g.63874 Transcript_32615/m.63874 type:complete len:211 (+) Transcript_32615:713-1345(+)